VRSNENANTTTQAQRRKLISAIPTPVSKPRSGAVVTAPPSAPRATLSRLFVGGCGVGFLRAAFWAGRAALSPLCHGAFGPWLRAVPRGWWSDCHGAPGVFAAGVRAVSRPPPERTCQRCAANVGGARLYQGTRGTFPPAMSWAAPDANEDRVAGDSRGEHVASAKSRCLVSASNTKPSSVAGIGTPATGRRGLTLVSRSKAAHSPSSVSPRGPPEPVREATRTKADELGSVRLATGALGCGI
jgi:hypothetical protein